MRTDHIGLYVHIPYCIRKCNYCDFTSFKNEDKSEYIKALCDEIDTYKGRGLRLDTVFFGGGTPSLLAADEFEVITSHIKDSFDLDRDFEFTLEANPKTLTEEKLTAYISCGVNRISLGLQSIHENELKILGRIHNFEEFLSTYNMVKESGIHNINVDLMYGIPDQSLVSFEKTLRTVLSLDPTHVSVYGLILEENTPLFKMKDKLRLPTEDEECYMYSMATSVMSEFGFIHYEVSNYCKSGKECRHNLKYWRDEEYVGVGLSAYSYLDSYRFGNTASLHEYISGRREAYREAVDSEGEAYEYVMLRTRLKEGFSLEDYEKRFGKDFRIGRQDELQKLSDSGFIRIENGRLRFTDKGMYVGNSLLTELI